MTAENHAQPEPEALPHPSSPEASAMIDSVLAEYGWPANAKNAARAGYVAARRLMGWARKPLPDFQAPEGQAALKDLIAWVEGGGSILDSNVTPLCKARAALAAQPQRATAGERQAAAADWTDVRMELEAAGRNDLSAWVESRTAPAEGDELTTGRQYLLTSEYGAAMVEMAKHYDMSVDNVLRAAIRLYQAQRFGSIKIEHVRDSKLFDPDVQPKGTQADMVLVPLGLMQRAQQAINWHLEPNSPAEHNATMLELSAIGWPGSVPPTQTTAPAHERVKRWAEQHHVSFVSRSHGLASTDTISFAALEALAVGQAPAVGAIPTVREFTNELGNAIRIIIEGPNSTSENVLTPMEGAELRCALNQHAASLTAVVQSAEPLTAFPVYNGDGTVDREASMRRAAASIAMEQIAGLAQQVSVVDECDRAMLAYAICPELRGRNSHVPVQGSQP